MKITPKQQKDLIVSMYFIPQCMSNIQISEIDKKMYLEWSESGLHKDKINTYKIDGFNALVQGKEWRGVHMQMFEDGVLEGTMPYYTILGGDSKEIKRKWWQFWKPKYRVVNEPIPREVVDFMKKEMFKGVDNQQIENAYQEVLKNT